MKVCVLVCGEFVEVYKDRKSLYEDAKTFLEDYGFGGTQHDDAEQLWDWSLGKNDQTPIMIPIDSGKEGRPDLLICVEKELVT